MKIRRLKDLREDRDWTQQFLANKLYMTQSTYSSYENGSHQIPLDTLITLAKLYHISVDYLLELTDNPTPPEPNKKLPG